MIYVGIDPGRKNFAIVAGRTSGTRWKIIYVANLDVSNGSQRYGAQILTRLVHELQSAFENIVSMADPNEPVICGIENQRAHNQALQAATIAFCVVNKFRYEIITSKYDIMYLDQSYTAHRISQKQVVGSALRKLSKTKKKRATVRWLHWWMPQHEAETLEKYLQDETKQDDLADAVLIMLRLQQKCILMCP